MQQIISTVGPYVPLVVFLNVLVSQAGLPLPALPTLLTAGAFAGGAHDLAEVMIAGVGGAVLGDLVPYWCGRRYGRRALALICRLSISPDFCVRRTETVFTRIGIRCLLFVKFLPGLSQISLVMAGVTKIPAAAFLLFDWLGALLFVGAALAVGQMFRNVIANLLSILADLGEVGVVVIVAALALYVAAKWWRRQMFIRQLRMDRITVGELRKLIADGERPIILDVRSSAARAEGIIPGAVAAHPTDIDRAAIDVPLDREIVIYCACPNEASAAIAAQHLRRAGFTRIRPLLGGIDAWVEAGETVERPHLPKDELLGGPRVAA